MSDPTTDGTTPAAPNELSGEKFVVRRMDGYMLITWANDVEISETDAMQAIETIEIVSSGRPVPLLVDGRSMRSIDRAGRTAFATADVIKVGLLVGSALSRTVGGFFLRLAKPSRPMHMFTDEAEAIAWLTDGN